MNRPPLPFLLLALCCLSACAGLLPSLAGDPPALYELHAPGDPVSGPPLKSQVLVDIPQSSAGIDSPRIALTQTDGTLAYFKDVSWTDRAPVMFQTLIVNSFDASGRLPAVGRENMGLRSDFLLKTDLSALQADYTAGPVPVVRVALRSKLIVMPRRIIVASHLATAEVKADTDTMPAIQAAFRQATGDVLQQTTRWTLDQLAEQERKEGRTRR